MGGAQFQIFGQVVLDTADATGKTQQMGRAIGDVGKAGAAGLGQLNSAQYEATQAARLLAMQFGVVLPRSVAKFVASVGPMQAILSTAFEAVAIFTLMRAIAGAVTNTKKFQETLYGIFGPISDLEVKLANLVGLLKDYSTEAIAAAEAGKKQAEEGLKLAERLMKAQDELNVLRAKGIDKIEAERVAHVHALQIEMAAHSALDAVFYQGLINIENLTAAEKKHQEVVKQAEELAKKVAQAEKELESAREGMMSKIASATDDTEAKIRAEYQTTYDLLNRLEEEALLKHENIERVFTLVTQAQAAEREKIYLEEAKKRTESVQKAQEEYQAAMVRFGEESSRREIDGLTGIARIRAEAAAEQLRVQDELNKGIIANQKSLDATIIGDAERVAQNKTSLERAAADEITAINVAAGRKAVEQLAGQIESFIDRVFLTARSLSDVFHQFLMQVLGSFVKWASQMIAQAILGMRQVSGAGGGVGGGGGLLGSILGGVFGIGRGTSALASVGIGGEPGWSGAQSLTLPGGGYIQGVTGPLSAGAIGQLGGGIPQAVGGAAQGGLGYAAFHPGQLLGNLATLGPLAAILGGASLMGRGGVGSGVAGGMLAAGGASYAMFGLAGLGVLPLAIGALVGGLIGMVRRGRQKRKSAALEQGFEFAADDVEKAYELHKLDYESAISQLEGLMASGQQTLLGAGTGRWGRQGAENLTRVIRDLINRVNDLEGQRQATTTTLAGMTIPEFAVGGSVPGLGTRGSGLGGGILAILHPGEFVMRQQAVDYLGQNFLAALNRAPAFAAGGNVGTRDSGLATRGRAIHIENLNVYPEKGMSDREAADMVVRGLRLASREGAL